MNKSISTRIRITRNGKILRRAMGIGHNRTRHRQSAVRHKKVFRTLDHAPRSIKHYSG